MSQSYVKSALKVVVAQICQNMGWNGIQTTPLEVLVDIVHRYLESLSKTTHVYCEQYGRTEPNLDDLGLAFKDMGVVLSELEEFVNNVEPVTFVHDVPKFPVAKPTNLRFPKPGSRELQQRPEWIEEHLPPIYPEMEEEDCLQSTGLGHGFEGTSSRLDGSLAGNSCEPTSPSESPRIGSRRPLEISNDTNFSTPKRPRLEEEGRQIREVTSVTMTATGVISPVREGKLPDSKTPIKFPEDLRPATPPTPAMPTALTADIPPRKEGKKEEKRFRDKKAKDRTGSGRKDDRKAKEKKDKENKKRKGGKGKESSASFKRDKKGSGEGRSKAGEEEHHDPKDANYTPPKPSTSKGKSTKVPKGAKSPKGKSGKPLARQMSKVSSPSKAKKASVKSPKGGRQAAKPKSPKAEVTVPGGQLDALMAKAIANSTVPKDKPFPIDVKQSPSFIQPALEAKTPDPPAPSTIPMVLLSSPETPPVSTPPSFRGGASGDRRKDRDTSGMSPMSDYPESPSVEDSPERLVIDDNPQTLELQEKEHRVANMIDCIDAVIVRGVKEAEKEAKQTYRSFDETIDEVVRVSAENKKVKLEARDVYDFTDEDDEDDDAEKPPSERVETSPVAQKSNVEIGRLSPLRKKEDKRPDKVKDKKDVSPDIVEVGRKKATPVKKPKVKDPRPSGVDIFRVPMNMPDDDTARFFPADCPTMQPSFQFPRFGPSQFNQMFPLAHIPPALLPYPPGGSGMMPHMSMHKFPPMSGGPRPGMVPHFSPLPPPPPRLAEPIPNITVTKCQMVQEEPADLSMKPKPDVVDFDVAKPKGKDHKKDRKEKEKVKQKRKKDKGKDKEKEKEKEKDKDKEKDKAREKEKEKDKDKEKEKGKEKEKDKEGKSKKEKAPKVKGKEKDKDKGKGKADKKEKEKPKKKEKEDKFKEDTVGSPSTSSSSGIPRITFKLGTNTSTNPVPEGPKIVIKPFAVDSPTASPLSDKESTATLTPLPLPNPIPPTNKPVAKPQSKVNPVPPAPKKTLPPSEESPPPHPLGPARTVITETLGTVTDDHGNKIWICPACTRPDDGSPMIGCDECDEWYHWVCVGIVVPPKEEEHWYCTRCVQKKQPGQKRKKKHKKEK